MPARQRLKTASGILHRCEHGKLNHDDYGPLEGYQREVKQVLDRRNADRPMFRP